jgi:hypothetical protein
VSDNPKTAHKNVYTALCAAQAEMGPLIKGSVNPAFKSKYADLADLVQAVREPLGNAGLAYFHQIIDGNVMRTVLMHGETETSIICDVPLIVAKNDMQGMKSATTYAKRIGLESVTGVAPEDDDGNAAAKAPPPMDERPIANNKAVSEAVEYLTAADDIPALAAAWNNLPNTIRSLPAVIKAKDDRKAALQAVPPADFSGDELPY